MGAEKSKSAEYEESVVLFSEHEQQQIGGIFHWLSDKSRDGFTSENLYAYTKDHLSKAISTNLFVYMANVIFKRPDMKTGLGKVNEEAFLVSIAHVLKASPEQRSSLISSLANGNYHQPVTKIQMKKFIEEILESYKLCLIKGEEIKSWKITEAEPLSHFIDYMLHSLFKTGVDTVDLYDLEMWSSSSPLCLHMLDLIFHESFPVTFVDSGLAVHPLIPMCEEINWARMSSLLTVPSLLVLSQCLPTDLRSPWQPLFSSGFHGESFSTMSRLIMNKGPNLMVIRDTGGHVFGAFASDGWSHNANFYGSSQCFLFTIHPKLEIFCASGYNNHFMYFNQGQETLPNGLGFGGQFDYFGLWLEYEFGKGHSKGQPHCTTFCSPSLSSTPEFDIECIEIWKVGNPRNLTDSDEDEMDIKTSILDKDPEAKAMLCLLDKGPRSEGMRETDAQADIPEVHSISPSTSPH